MLITVALLVDLVSFALGMRRLRGDGASGVPVIGLITFAAGALTVYWSGRIRWDAMIRYIKWYAVVHVALQFGLLLILHSLLRLWEKRRSQDRN
mgnify:CR=1 FL=1